MPLTGFGGQVSLCQMSFAAIGALVMAHHGQGGDPMALLLAAVVCAVVGALVALPALRLSGLYLALATAAFAVFLDRWVFLFRSFELGPWTIKLWEGGVVAVDPVDIPGIDTTDRQTQLVVLACVAALGYLLVVAVRRSGFGQRLLAMKDSPAACATLGIDITRLKLGVFALSAAMAGVGGALYAGTLGSVSPERFNLFESLPAPAAHRRRWHRHRRRGALRRRASSAGSRSPSPPGRSSRTSTACCPAPWASRSAATRTGRSATSGAATPCSARCPPRSSGSVASLVVVAASRSPESSPVGAPLRRRRRPGRVAPGRRGRRPRRRRPSPERHDLEWAGIDRPLTDAEVRDARRARSGSTDPEGGARVTSALEVTGVTRAVRRARSRSTTSTSPPSRARSPG